MQKVSSVNSRQSNELLANFGLLSGACSGVICSSIVLPFYSIGPLVVPITDEFGWTRAEFQLSILFSTGVGVLTAPVVGWLNDRYGSRRLALSGLFGLGIAFMLASRMNGDLRMLYAAYTAMAFLGAGTIPVTWTRAITTNFFRQRGLALGIMLSGTGICGIIIPYVTTLLVEALGWRGAYFVLGLLPLLLAGPMVFFFFKPDAGIEAGSADGRERSRGLTLPQAAGGYRFWLLLVSIFLVYMAMSGITPNLIPALTDIGVDPLDAAKAMSAFGVAVIVGRLAVGYLVDRLWAPGVAAISIGLAVFGSFLLYGETSMAVAVVAAFLLGFAAGAELDLMSFLAARYFGLLHYAKIYAVLYAALALASGIAPMLFARVFDVTGSYDLGFLLAAGSFVMGAGLLLAMGPYPVARVDAKSA